MADKLKRIAMGMGPWLHKKIVDPLVLILRRGAEPKQLAFSAALGITLGIFPICGVTVFLCGLAIAVLGSLCHAPTVMLANFVATPIELRKGRSVKATERKEGHLDSNTMSFPYLTMMYFVYPEMHNILLQVLADHNYPERCLVIPFLRFGEVISGGSHFSLTSDAFKKVLTGQASREVIQSVFHALLGWLVAAPFILATLYILSLPCFKILVSKFSPVPSSPKKPLQPHTEVRLKVRDA